MRLLLDTQALIWWLDTPERLKREAHRAIEDPRNSVYTSVVALWEIAIKLRLRKIRFRPNLASWVPDELAQQRFTVLPVELSHAMAVEHLHLHHNDPFDRLLIAQAQAERLTIVTADEKFRAYDVPVIWT